MDSDHSIEVFSKTPKDIENEVGRKFIDILHEYIDKGYSPTEIARELKLKTVRYVPMYLAKEQKKIEFDNLNEDDFIIKGFLGKTFYIAEAEERFRNELGIEFKDFIYQKHINEGLSLFEITKITGIKEWSLRRYIHMNNIHKSMKQVRRDAINKGSINYKEIVSKSRKTRDKSKSKSFKQDSFRDLIKYYIEKELIHNNTTIEFIIGLNEWGILHDKEVDIPIIFIDDNKIHKFAIEFNGEHWHNTKDDNTKKNRLINKGWTYLSFKETAKTTSSMIPTEKGAQEIVNQIMEHINT